MKKIYFIAILLFASFCFFALPATAYGPTVECKENFQSMEQIGNKVYATNSPFKNTISVYTRISNSNPMRNCEDLVFEKQIGPFGKEEFGRDLDLIGLSYDSNRLLIVTASHYDDRDFILAIDPTTGTMIPELTIEVDTLSPYVFLIDAGYFSVPETFPKHYDGWVLVMDTFGNYREYYWGSNFHGIPIYEWRKTDYPIGGIGGSIKDYKGQFACFKVVTQDWWNRGAELGVFCPNTSSYFSVIRLTSIRYVLGLGFGKCGELFVIGKNVWDKNVFQVYPDITEKSCSMTSGPYGNPPVIGGGETTIP